MFHPSDARPFPLASQRTPTACAPAFPQKDGGKPFAASTELANPAVATAVLPVPVTDSTGVKTDLAEAGADRLRTLLGVGQPCRQRAFASFTVAAAAAALILDATLRRLCVSPRSLSERGDASGGCVPSERTTHGGLVDGGL